MIINELKLLLNESLDLIKPFNVKYNKYIKNAGTNTAHMELKYEFTTSLNNNVKLIFNPKHKGEYDIKFYVNDNLNPTSKVRDIEILGGVFYLILKAITKLNITTFTFEAYKDDGDVKTIRNLKQNNVNTNLLNILKKLQNIVNNFNLDNLDFDNDSKIFFNKFNKPLPDKHEYYIQRLSKNISNIIDSVEKLESINLRNILFELSKLSKIGFDYDTTELIQYTKEYNKIIDSNSESGYKQENNRRETIYNKFIDKYLKSWKVTNFGNFYTVTNLKLENLK